MKMTMSFNLEKATMDRIEECQEVFRDSLLYNTYCRDNCIQSWVKEGVEKGEVYLAVSSSNEVIGYMWIEWYGFVGAFPYLALFGVKKQYRGQGVGRSMLRIYEGLCREMGFKKCTMMVSKPNVRARRLYQSEGFVKRGEVPGFVFPDVDEFIMIKDLK